MTDFESQNEEWISICKRALMKTDDVALHLATRAGRLGTLQCALVEKSSCNVSVNTLFRHTIEEMTIEATSNLCQLERLAPPPQRQQQPAVDPPSQISSLDVDAFFEEYSECMKPKWDQCAALDSDDSEDEEQNFEYRRPEKEVKRRGPEHIMHRPLLPHQNNHELASTGNQPPGVASNPYPKRANSNNNNANSSSLDKRNPYATSTATSNVFHHTPATHGNPRQDSWGNNKNSNTKSNSLPQRNSHLQQQNHSTISSWENHQHQQNPFQTARELAQIEENDNTHTTKSRPQDTNSNWNHQNEYQNRSQNPYAAHHPVNESSNTGPAHGGPSIPDSLKRKFQLPKRPADGNASGKQNSQGSYPALNRNGGGVQVTRPSSTSSRNSKNNGNRNNNSADDDDELPEELQHLDKELVKKIQNEIMESGDMVTFDDIAGLDDAKQTVQEVVCWPMKRPDLFTGLRRAPNGLLLYGPPGTGKTLIGKAIAYESGATFFSISSSSLTSKWIGEGEKLVRTLFAVAAYREPAVVFIDEIDSLLTQRKASENEASRRIKTEFLVQLDGTGTSGQGRVLVIGATNRPQELDEAARRRFTKRLYIPLPSENDRSVLLHVMLNKNNHRLTNEDVEKLAKETNGFSGADLKALCTDAAMGPIRQLGPKALSIEIKDVPPISFKHFRRSLKGTRPSVATADLVQYEEWDKVFGSKRASEDDDTSDEE